MPSSSCLRSKVVFRFACVSFGPLFSGSEGLWRFPFCYCI